MSFKGRIVGTRSLTDDVINTVGNGDVIATISAVKDIPIRYGLTVRLNHGHETIGYQYNYSIKVLDSVGQMVQVGNYTNLDFEFTIEVVAAVGIVFVSEDENGGTYNLNWIIWATDNTLIDNPVLAIKHIKQCQNWSELNFVEAGYSWGKQLVPEALIKTSGEGSFNSTTLDEIKALKIARQIFDYDRAWSDDLVQSLCEQFFLISYQDENGYECLKSLLTKENPSTIITFGDIVGPVGDIIEPRMSDIYCAPIINYAYDYATEKFTRQLRVENVWESTFNAAYCPGIEAADAEDIWNECHALWAKVRQIEPMPSNLTDRSWVPDYDTALWCLHQQLKLMTLKRCSFSVGYTVGRKWDIGTHFKLQLPHETNNHAIECVVEEIVKKKDSNLVTVQVILLDVIESSFFFEE